MDSEGTGQTGLSTAERVAAAHPTCPLPATGSSLSRTQGPQVGPFHLGLSRLAGGGHEACPSCPTALLPSPAARGPIFLAAPSPRAWRPQQRTLSLSYVHALSFLSVRLTFLLSRWLFTCSSLPLLSRPFSVVGYTLSLPESLSHSSLAYAWTPFLPSTRAPRGGGGGLLALQGPQKLSWSWGRPSCLASPSCTFSPSLFLAPLPTSSRSISPPWFSLQTESYTGTHTHPALKTGS